MPRMKLDISQEEEARLKGIYENWRSGDMSDLPKEVVTYSKLGWQRQREVRHAKFSDLHKAGLDEKYITALLNADFTSTDDLREKLLGQGVGVLEKANGVGIKAALEVMFALFKLEMMKNGEST